MKFSPNCPWTSRSRPSSFPSSRYDSIWYTNTARCSPPWPARSPCPSPSTFSLRTRRGPATGSLNTPVNTVRPCQGTSFGMPTLTDSSFPADSAARSADATRRDPELMTTQRSPGPVARRRATALLDRHLPGLVGQPRRRPGTEPVVARAVERDRRAVEGAAERRGEQRDQPGVLDRLRRGAGSAPSARPPRARSPGTSPSPRSRSDPPRPRRPLCSSPPIERPAPS